MFWRRIQATVRYSFQRVVCWSVAGDQLVLFADKLCAREAHGLFAIELHSVAFQVLTKPAGM